MSEENKKRFDIVRVHSYDVCQFGIFDHVATVPSMYIKETPSPPF